MKINDRLSDFMQKETVSTLAVPIDDIGTIHIAALRCMVSVNPLAVYYVTSVSSEKCALFGRLDELPAACDLGGHLDPEMYVQMRGKLRYWRLDEKKDIVDAYFNHIDATDRTREGKDSVLLEFTPEYMKFTDYAEGWEKHIIDL